MRHLVLLTLVGAALTAQADPGDRLGMYLLLQQNASEAQAQGAAEDWRAWQDARVQALTQRVTGTRPVLDVGEGNPMDQADGVMGPGYTIDFQDVPPHRQRRQHR